MRGTSAFGRLYTEHFDGLYDFVARIVGDRDLAGEIVQTTFTKAWDELRAGRDLKHPKAWLYTVARNHALDELRRRRRLSDEPILEAQPDPSRLADPQAVAEDNEIVELVWASAAALNPDEYSLLDLHVRRGLDAAELAEAMHLERGAVYTRLSRLRNSLQDSVTSTLLVRRGREDCAELEAIVAEHDIGNGMTPELRLAVRSHVKECDICGEARRRLVAHPEFLALATPIVVLPGVREGIWQAIAPGGATHAAGASVVGGKGAAARQGGKAKYVAAGAGGIAAAVAALSIALSSGPTVRDPARASSVDHAVGVPSSDRTVTMRWSPGTNARGYSVIFSRDRALEPAARENVTGTQYTSGALAPGRWWFILRTHGAHDTWTHTLRVGPFVITAATARASQPALTPPAKKATQRRQRRARAPAPAGPVIVAGVPAAQQPQPGVAPDRPATKKQSKAKPPRAPASQPPVKKPPAAKPTPAKPPPTKPPTATSPPAAAPPTTVAPSPTPPPAQEPTATPAPPAPVVTPPPSQGGGGGGDDDDEGDHGHHKGGHK